MDASGWWTILQMAITLGTIIGVIYFGFSKQRKSNQSELDTVNAELIESQRKRIDFLKEALDTTNNRLGALEIKYAEDREAWAQQQEELKKAMEALYLKNKELSDMIAGRDPEIQRVLNKSDKAIDVFLNGTAPKVDQIHERLVPKI